MQFGPNHPEMGRKLGEMDGVIRHLANNLPKVTNCLSYRIFCSSIFLFLYLSTSVPRFRFSACLFFFCLFTWPTISAKYWVLKNGRFLKFWPQNGPQTKNQKSGFTTPPPVFCHAFILSRLFCSRTLTTTSRGRGGGMRPLHFSLIDLRAYQ